VRAALAGDAAAIARTHVEAWEAAYRGLVDDEALDRELNQDLASEWASVIEPPWPPGSRVLLAELQAEIAGHCWCGPARDDDTDPQVVGEIYALYVRPDAWGKGCGSTLIESAQRYLAQQGAEQATLWVAAQNERARRFYGSQGFVADGRDDKPFCGTVRQLRLRKALS